METLQLRYRLTVRDTKTGRLVRRTRWRAAHSYTQALMWILLSQMSQATTSTATKDTAGTNRTAAIHTVNLALNGAAGDDSFGLMVGTGATAVDISDNKLETAIADGTGAGQLDYRADDFSVVLISGQTASFTVTRTFINSSGGSITVTEIGMYARLWSGSASIKFLIVRDIVSGGVTVLNGKTATLEYTLGITA